jgi:hypothetical protein
MSDAITSVIENAVAELPGSDAAMAAEDTSVDETPTTDVATETPAQPVAEAAAVEGEQQQQAPAMPEQQDELLVNEFGGNKHNRIPYNRVRKIVDNALAKRDAEHTEKLKSYEELKTQWEGGQNEFRQLVQQGPKQLLSVLAHYYPQQYAEFVQKAFAPAQQPAQAAPEPIQPDVQLQDGSYGYSQGLLDQVIEQRAAAIERAVEERLSQRFAPIENEFKTRRLTEEASAKVTRQLEDARKLPKFSENEDAIADALAADPALSLERAYMQVVAPKLQADRDKMRQELLAELNAKPRAASTPGRAPAAPVNSGPKTTEDVIRESLGKRA